MRYKKNILQNIVNICRNKNKVTQVSYINHSLNQNKDSSLEHLMKNVIFVGQIFSLFPVDGLAEYKAKFRWFSIKTFYAIFVILFQMIYTTVIVFKSDLDLQRFFNFVVIMWNIRALVVMLVFFKMGVKWPSFIKQWNDIESEMENYGPIPTLKRRFRILSLVLAFLGTFEHLIFVGGATKKVISSLNETDDFFQRYFEIMYEEFFSNIEYSHWKGALIEIVSLISTFAWQFNNVIIILLTSTLAERFKQIAKKIKTKNHYTLRWNELRHHYNQLSILCKTVNSTISNMVLLSFIGNIYFVSESILQSFTPKTPYETFYFWYDILFHVMHLALVSTYAAWIDEESKSPISDILAVPLNNSQFEVDRFIFQIAESSPAIYVGGMFKITGSTVLHVTSVILTLQLVYAQFEVIIPQI